VLFQSFYRLLEKESIGLTKSIRNFLRISFEMRITAALESDGPGARLLESVPPKRRDIVAKDLTASRILLSLYFTIFLNQLDNILAYTENGTIRPRSGLVGASFSWFG
jgi:hypothetical protein